MKKFLVTLALAATFAAAADDCSLLAFSSKGPDAYADGTPALAGECYALVWIKNGAAFMGLNADGTTVSPDNRVVLVAPVAKRKVVDGETVAYCPPVLFQISNALIDRLGAGSYGVFLLDTRVAKTDAEGKTTCAVGGAKNVASCTAVESAGAVTTSAVKGDVLTTLAGESAPAGGALSAGAPADVKQPAIKGIKVEGGNVYLTVENLAGFMRVQGGETPAAEGAPGAAVATDGGDKDVVLVYPAKGNAGFFKVIRNK